MCEINEDNCVLEDWELDNIGNAFYILVQQEEKGTKKLYDEYFRKIKKLNDMAKGNIVYSQPTKTVLSKKFKAKLNEEKI